MNESEAIARLDRILRESMSMYYQHRLDYMKNNEPSICVSYKEFVEAKINVQEFYTQATSNIMAANSPLGKLL